MTTQSTARPSALNTMRHRLRRVQQAQENCVNPFGYIETSRRERYNELCKEAAEYRQAIETLEKIYGQ